MSDPDLPSPSQRNRTSIPSPFSNTVYRLLMALVILLGILGLIGFFKLSQSSYGHPRTGDQIKSIAISYGVAQFCEDYDRLPLPSGPRLPGGDCDTDTSPSHGFTAVLMGKEGETADRQNERNVDYLEGIKPAKNQQGTAWNYVNGRITNSTVGSYGIVDSNGNPFRIRLDTNGDKILANPNPDQAAAEGLVALATTKGVIVWSAGNDGDWNTWDDNPKSWD
ncbi:MAG: hypothetical protein V4675_08230 [Verrucomicrobiota bacterium]